MRLKYHLTGSQIIITITPIVLGYIRCHQITGGEFGLFQFWGGLAHSFDAIIFRK